MKQRFLLTKLEILSKELYECLSKIRDNETSESSSLAISYKNRLTTSRSVNLNVNEEKNARKDFTNVKFSVIT